MQTGEVVGGETRRGKGKRVWWIGVDEAERVLAAVQITDRSSVASLRFKSSKFFNLRVRVVYE